MASAGLDTIAALLKEFYLGPVREQLNNEVLLLSRLESSSQEIVGEAAHVPLHFGRSGGIGPARERGALPASGFQRYEKAVYDLTSLFGRGEVTGESVAKSKSDAGAFLRVLTSEVDGLRKDLKKDLSRQMYGDGSAVIAGIASVAGSVLTLDNAEAIKKGQLYLNMLVDVGTAANPVAGTGGAKITAINVATPSVTVDVVGASTAAHDISRAGARDASGSIEIAGIQNFVHTTAGTAFGGLDPDTHPEWENIRETTGGAITMDRILTVQNEIRVAGGDSTLMITTFGLQRRVFNLLQSQVQYIEPMKIEGGFSTLNIMGQPLVADVDAPWGKIFLLDEDEIKVYATHDWKFLDEDGSVLKWKTGYNAWEFALWRYMNVGVTRRNTQAVISGLTDTGV